MKDLYYWLKRVDQLAIPVTISLKLLCFVFQESENCVGGAGILESLGRGMDVQRGQFLFVWYIRTMRHRKWIENWKGRIVWKS